VEKASFSRQQISIFLKFFSAQMPDLTWKMALLDHQEKPILATLICTQNFNLISQTISDIRLSQKIQMAVTTIMNFAESSNVHQMWPVMTSFL